MTKSKISPNNENAKFEDDFPGSNIHFLPIKAENFAPRKQLTKSDFVRHVTNLARQARLDEQQFSEATRQIRKRLGLRRRKKSKRLPKLLSKESARDFFAAVDGSNDFSHPVIIRLFWYTGCRVNEAVNIKRVDVDLEKCTIRIENGKGGKDRNVLFPEAFRPVLSTYMAATSDNVYLFESNRRSKYTTRRVQQLFKHYAKLADIETDVHPHLFRHQALTHLCKSGLADSQVQLVSGHSSRKSLEIYQHLSLADIEEDYQTAMKEILL